jgi:selenoprotein W-related protein
VTEEILSDRSMEYFIKDWQLIPDSGGKFEFVVNGELVYSKKQLGRHAEPGEIKALLQEKIDAYKQEHGINWDELPDD